MSRRTALAAAVAAVALGVPALPGSAAGACAVDLEQRNGWHLLSTSGAVAMADDDPCRLLGVGPGDVTRTSGDGGRTWTTVGAAPTAVRSLVTAGLATGHALALGTDGSAWRTTDAGRSWQRSSGVSGVARLVVDESNDGERVYALTTRGSGPLPVALPVGTGASLYRSTDGGRSFAAVTGAANLSITAVVQDANVRSRLWIGVAGPAGGLFRSTDDGSTFTRVSAGEVTDLASSRLAGGGSEVVATTTDGVLVTRDAGSTVTQTLQGTAFTGLSLEWRHPSALVLLAGLPRRSSNTARTARPLGSGLPAGCSASDLRRDRSVPSVFLVSCADATYRYRSDGTDLSAVDDPEDPQTELPGVTGFTPTPMRELGRRKVPHPDSKQDGSIAFDGRNLYYADLGKAGVVHRMRASDGADLPDIRIGVRRGVAQLAYDADRDHLLLVDTALVVWDVALPSGRAKKLFHADVTGRSEEDDEQDSSSRFYGAFTYDSTTKRLLFASDGSDSFTEYDLNGRLRHECARLGLQSVVIISGGPTYEASIAGMVATGDGLVYVEAEDDSTVIRIDRSCRVLATYQHERFSEAPNENDALACDTSTFDTPAVWLRDAQAAVMVAYSVDSGYCALPSTVSVSAPPGVSTGSSGTVCAHLETSARHEPMAGQPVDLLVAGRGIGRPRTDARGTACTRYVPLSGEAGSGTGSARTRQPVVAAFLGTPAYRPATARASTVVSRSALPVVPLPPLPPPAPQPPPPAVHTAPVVVAVPPPPPVQPPPPPPNVPQQQPIAQAHPGAQPGAMGALGSAPVPEGEDEAAAQTADTHLMTGLETAGVGAVLMWVVARRRREARVRPATR